MANNVSTKKPSIRGVNSAGMYDDAERRTLVCLLTSISAFMLAGCSGGGGGGDSSASPTKRRRSPQHGVDLPPTSSGAPLTAIVYGRTYSFAPTATDPERTRLSFNILNKPVWASFDPITGTLEGTPEASDVGAYDDITISVSDGLYLVSLRSFSVDVVGTASGSITVQWLPPTERDDGTPLTDLAGYNLRCTARPLSERGHDPECRRRDLRDRRAAARYLLPRCDGLRCLRR